MSEFYPHSPEIRSYLQKIRDFPLLTLPQEYQLAKEWRDNQDSNALQKLIASHLKLVAKVAGGYRGYGLPLSDLIAEGNIGIMQALKNYDPEKGFRFATYALWWVKASIHDYILQSWSLVKIGTTRAQKKLFFGLRKTQQALKQEGETETEINEETVKKIAAKLEVKEEEVWQMHQRLNLKDSSLNQSSMEENEKEWIEWVVDERDNQETQLAQQDEYKKRKKLFDKALDCLTQREHEILTSRRLKEPPHTLGQVSEKLSLSRERVRQIENKAFLKIQQHIQRITSAPEWHHI